MPVPTFKCRCPTEVVIFPSPTSVASESGLTLQRAQKAKPHLQPHRHADIEAETPIPQSPCVQECSAPYASYAHAAALFAHPLKSHSLHLFTVLDAVVAINSTTEHVIIIVNPFAGNNFFGDFALFGRKSTSSDQTNTDRRARPIIPQTSTGIFQIPPRHTPQDSQIQPA